MGRLTTGPLVWSCIRQHVVSHKRVLFSTASPLLKSPRKPTRSPPIQVVHHKYQQHQQQRLAQEHATSDSQELVPLPDQETAVETAPRVNVPLRVIPKAQVAPNLRLTPKERLHIEQLTRVTPRPSAPPVYKRRLRIYSAGNPRIYFIIISRFAAVCALSFSTVLFVPAYIAAGTPLYVVAGGKLPLGFSTEESLLIQLAWLASAGTFAYVNWSLRPFVTEVFLQLPEYAQSTPKAAMEYAKKLPDQAMLDIRFLRLTAITDVVSLRLSQTMPARSIFRPVSFEWMAAYVQASRFWKPTPTQFYVRTESAKGRAARNTTPGIWSKVYERLTGVKPDARSRWQR
ncbi:hypothetical protein LTR84_000036 [Exophiala bonariae]|uniref:Uncharacterized protein n=1 Tax=Exophiala bonariae TaxID=1690606 RepID=A0AAV9NTH8_9EURO|nr:hypothetical protein LTR84_000036 [Exophiala bonariae]